MQAGDADVGDHLRLVPVRRQHGRGLTSHRQIAGAGGEHECAPPGAGSVPQVSVLSGVPDSSVPADAVTAPGLCAVAAAAWAAVARVSSTGPEPGPASRPATASAHWAGDLPGA